MRRTLVLLLLAVCAYAAWQRLRRPAAVSGLTEITVDDLNGQLRAPSEQPTLVVLYRTTCPRTQAVFANLSAVARRYQAQGARVQAYSVDFPEDVAGISPFLEMNHAPFAPVHVKPWAIGSLGSALAPAGIAIGDEWVTPLVAVRSRSGRIVAEGEGVVDMAPFEQALRSQF